MLGDLPTPGRGPPHRQQATLHRSGPPSEPAAVPRPTGTGVGASGTSPALDVGASQALDRESPQRSSPTLPMPMRRTADGVGIGQAIGVHLYHTWSTKESRSPGSARRSTASGP